MRRKCLTMWRNSTHGAQPLATFVRELGPVATWDCAISVGKEQQVHGRLVVTRVAQAVADQRRARIRQHAQHQHRMPSAAALALADWNVVFMNAPRMQITATEVWTVMRVRWQIELLFNAMRGSMTGAPPIQPGCCVQSTPH